jgi:hypothetical protein
MTQRCSRRNEEPSIDEGLKIRASWIYLVVQVTHNCDADNLLLRTPGARRLVA